MRDAREILREHCRERMLDAFYEASDSGEDVPPDLSRGVRAVYIQALGDAAALFGGSLQGDADDFISETIRKFASDRGIDPGADS